MDLASYFYLNILTQIDASNCFMADMEPASGLLLLFMVRSRNRISPDDCNQNDNTDTYAKDIPAECY